MQEDHILVVPLCKTKIPKAKHLRRFVKAMFENRQEGSPFLGLPSKQNQPVLYTMHSLLLLT